MNDDDLYDFADQYEAKFNLQIKSTGSSSKKKKLVSPTVTNLPKVETAISKTIKLKILDPDFSDEFLELNSKENLEFVFDFNEMIETITKNQHYRKTIYTTNIDKLIKLAEDSVDFGNMIKNIKYIKKLDTTKDPYQLDYISSGLILFIKKC